jgi:hypothetical protein
MRKFFFALVIFALVFSGCSRRRDADAEYNEETQATYAEESPPELTPPAPTPEPPPPITETVTWQSHSRRLVSVTGIVTDLYGPVSEDGTVPWDIDWFEIRIEKDDGTPAIIVGVNDTVYIFGSMPQIGMEVTAYIEASVTFVNDPPLYVATAIVLGFEEYSFTICCAASDYACEDFSYIVANRRCFSNFRHGENFAVIVFYNETANDLPIAHNLVSFRAVNPLFYYYEEAIPEEMALNFFDYIFPADAFEIVNLPIFLNGEELNSHPAIYAADGTTILVPFREAMSVGVGIASGAYLFDIRAAFIHVTTYDGTLNFLEGGGGSENIYWQLGRSYARNISPTDVLELCSPPIIVGGIVYVPLISGVMGAGYNTNAWLFEDRIEIYGFWIPYGRWIVDFTNPHERWSRERRINLTEEELAALPIIINGVEMEAYHAIFSDEWHEKILIPLAAFAEGLGYFPPVQAEGRRFLLRNSQGEEINVNARIIDDEPYLDLEWLPRTHGIIYRGIVYDGQILIRGW